MDFFLTDYPSLCINTINPGETFISFLLENLLSTLIRFFLYRLLILVGELP